MRFYYKHSAFCLLFYKSPLYIACEKTNTKIVSSLVKVDSIEINKLYEIFSLIKSVLL